MCAEKRQRDYKGHSQKKAAQAAIAVASLQHGAGSGHSVSRGGAGEETDL